MKIRGSIYFKLIIVLILLQGCREVFYPKIEKYENILVIDGLITDQEGGQVVRLTRSYSFHDNYPRPEEGAVVKIIDEDQNEQLFTEDQPGVYLCSNNFKGEIGRSYKLSLLTMDGNSYESDWEEIRPIPEIDKVTLEFQERPTVDPYNSRYGVQVKTSSQDLRNETRYYRWEWTETWEFITPTGSTLYPNEQRCWKSSTSSTISIATTEHLTEDILDDHPIYFVSTETNKLKIRYSSLISQFSMSQESYSYFKSLQDISHNMGSLFDPTPYMVTGNLHNLNHPDVPVLGIFQASAVTHKRIFINRSDLPRYLYIPSGFEGCDFHTTADPDEIEYYYTHGYYFVDEYVDGGTTYKMFSNSDVCFRCTLSGTNEKPHFWPDD